MLIFLLSLIDNETDRRKVESLFNKYEHKMLATALYILKNQQLAEDAVQDVFVSVIKHLDRLDENNNIEAYLLKSVRHRAIDIIRKENREKVTFDAIEKNNILYQREVQSEAEDIDYVEYAARIIVSLPTNLSTVFILHYQDDLSCVQIADRLNISYDAAFKRLQRARNILKKRMKDRGFLDE